MYVKIKEMRLKRADVFESKGVRRHLRVAREGSEEWRGAEAIFQKYGRPALNQEQLNRSQQENGLAGADMPAVATNFAQAQIARLGDRQRNGEGSELAHAARLSEIVCIASGDCRRKFQDKRSRRSLQRRASRKMPGCAGQPQPKRHEYHSVGLRVN